MVTVAQIYMVEKKSFPAAVPDSWKFLENQIPFFSMA